MPTQQRLLWIPARTRGTIVVPYDGPRPTAAWTLPRERDEAAPPALPFYPTHRVNAMVEDVGHDWSIRGRTFCYSSQTTDGGVWVLLEF